MYQRYAYVVQLVQLVELRPQNVLFRLVKFGLEAGEHVVPGREERLHLELT